MVSFSVVYLTAKCKKIQDISHTRAPAPQPHNELIYPALEPDPTTKRLSAVPNYEFMSSKSSEGLFL